MEVRQRDGSGHARHTLFFYPESCFLFSVCPAGGVPGSAVLLFELELVKLQKGVPEGYMFVWLGDDPDPLFPAMDLDGNKEVPLEEVRGECLPQCVFSICAIFVLTLLSPSLQFSSFIMLQVKEGKGRLRPGVDADSIIKDMFDNQDLNKDGRIVEGELVVTEDSGQSRRDEL